jgi:hypothetical protein
MILEEKIATKGCLATSDVFPYSIRLGILAFALGCMAVRKRVRSLPNVIVAASRLDILHHLMLPVDKASALALTDCSRKVR